MHRARRNWRWRNISVLAAMGAMFGGILMGAFLVVFIHGLPVNHRTAPMIAFAVSIVVFNILSSIKLVQSTEVEFEDFCVKEVEVLRGAAGRTASDDNVVDPRWMRMVRGAFSVLFILIWIEAMAFFYVHERFVDSGTPQPTPTRTQYVNEHGTFVYFTDDEMRVHNLLETIMMIGIPGIILSGFVLHFIVGVPVFSNMPPSRGLFGRSNGGDAGPS
jgi:hypothetical protein